MKKKIRLIEASEGVQAEHRAREDSLLDKLVPLVN